MGLDITAYSNIEVVWIRDEYDEDMDAFNTNPDRYEQEWINPSFPHAVPPEFEPGGFLCWRKTDKTEDLGWRAGSYSGYNFWRNTLCLGSTSDELIWTEPEKMKVVPFYELINFSDCEGVMYGPVCEKLYHDFVNYREEYMSRHYEEEAGGWGNYDAERYDLWLKGFDLARQNGLLSFH